MVAFQHVNCCFLCAATERALTVIAKLPVLKSGVYRYQYNCASITGTSRTSSAGINGTSGQSNENKKKWQPRIYPSRSKQRRIPEWKQCLISLGNSTLQEKQPCNLSRSKPWRKLCWTTTIRTITTTGFQFRHQPRLNWPSMLAMTSEQITGIQDSIE